MKIVLVHPHSACLRRATLQLDSNQASVAQKGEGYEEAF